MKNKQRGGGSHMQNAHYIREILEHTLLAGEMLSFGGAAAPLSELKLKWHLTNFGHIYQVVLIFNLPTVISLYVINNLCFACDRLVCLFTSPPSPWGLEKDIIF